MPDSTETNRSTPRPRDVRMRGFAHRATVDDALAWVAAHAVVLPAETVPLAAAHGRVLAQDVISRVDVPSFDRAMMDGFALRSVDVAGASSYSPLPLRMVGEALAGRPYVGSVEAGEAVRIMTGAPLPAGADAVLPAEHAEADGRRLLARGEVSPGKHVGLRAEDVAAGTVVLNAGRRLRPQDVGLLSSIGVSTLEIVRAPRVRIIVTGDEVLPAGASAEPHRVLDANGPMLDALVHRDGGLPLNPGIVPDEPERIAEAMEDDAHDVVLVSGGSSVGQEDHAPRLLAERGELAIHGVAMRPSSPTGMGLIGGRLVFLLPGNPVSCLCAYDFFAARAIRMLAGRRAEWPYRSVRATLRRKISSVVGRVDYVRVARREEAWEPLAIGGASSLSSTTRADGFVVVPADSEGFPGGAEVDVWCYDLG